jgi:microcin C transport system permease protein
LARHYGFRASFVASFGFVELIIGGIIGSIEGYFGGWADILIQRCIEIWGAIPMLYALIIVSSIIEPTLVILVLLLSLFSWMGVQHMVRIEFLKARHREYVKAARALGVSNPSIMVRHILPNALTS